MDMIGKVLGNRYEVIEKIGTGGMATVYRAKCKVLNRFVAIKILKDEFANDTEFIKRFQVEAQSAASLSHQNIVSIFDVSEDDGMHYIVMELIEGKTLKEVINEKGKLPWTDAVKIAAQIAYGLSQAHKNHIIHRDIKPHNIIITKDGIAKVTDFGIAKAVSNSTINAFGSTIGSVHYFSPEHARGGYTDEKSDIYSLGVVLYEMCTGKLPFDAETPVSVALKHLQEKPKEPRELNPEIPEGVESIILKAMQKEVSNRYATALEMYNDLMKSLKNPDDISLGNMHMTKTEFPTQRIPVINNVQTKDEEKVEEKNIKEQDVDNMSKSKKRVTKKQALIKLLVFIVITIGVFFGCVELGKKLFSTLFEGNTTVVVPDVMGCSKEEAISRLEAVGLKLQVLANIPSDKNAGYIVYQEYSQGVELRKGEEVGVKISTGLLKISVPDITRFNSTTAAQKAIENKGLIYLEKYEFHDTISSGDIIRQEPTVDTQVTKGETVTVFVSMGRMSGDAGLVKVPDVLDYNEEDARLALDNVKLIPKVTYTKDISRPEGIVIGQMPNAGSYQPELTEIVLVVNKSNDNTSTEEDDDGKNENENENGNQNENQKPPVIAKKEIIIDLSSFGERSTFNVKVVHEGVTVGKRIEYDEEHSRGDGKIKVYVDNVPGSMVKVYIDDVVKAEQMI